MISTKKELEKYKTWVPPGHFYSPIPDKAEIVARKDQIYNPVNPLYGVNMNHQGQLEFLSSQVDNYKKIFFEDHENKKNRYYYLNSMFAYGDAISLFLILLKNRPKRIIEVGSGFSSAVMLDTLDYLGDNDCIVTFIEPYTERLNSLLRKGDRVEIVQSFVQDVNSETFKELEAGDLLFIDSTHVSKIGSDVNYLFFNILPLIKKGVFVHIHDIGLNFEYPLKWIEEGRAWNEAYLLRAFLQFNNSFEVFLHNPYIINNEFAFIRSNMPLYLKNGGGSFWMRRN